MRKHISPRRCGNLLENLESRLLFAYDLALSGLVLEAVTLDPGQAVQFAFSRGNVGDAPYTGQAVTRFYLTSDQTLGNADDILIGTVSLFSTYAAGEVVNLPAASATVGADTPGGHYYLGIVFYDDPTQSIPNPPGGPLAPPPDQINESVTANNYLVSTNRVTVTGTPPVAGLDVAASLLNTSGTRTYRAGAVFNENITIAIEGTLGLTAATPITARLYLSTDAVLGNADDQLVVEQTTAITAAAGSTGRQVLVQSNLPLITAPGTYYLIGQVTVDGATDVNPANNIAISPAPQIVLEPPAFFDAAWYLAANPDVAAAASAGQTTALQHYFTYGLPEGRSPSWFFSEAYYLAANPDVAQAVQQGQVSSGYGHYITYGADELRSPNAFFNEVYYRRAYPDVNSVVAVSDTITSGALHYWTYGRHEGRQPSARFHERAYRLAYPDVAAALAANALTSAYEHFMRWGRAENRLPDPVFSETDYLNLNPDVESAVTAGTFSSGLAHWLALGASEARTPTALFDPEWYLIEYPDVVTALNAAKYASAYQHFVVEGLAAGRSGWSHFNEADYLAANPDVAAAVAAGSLYSGFEHYLLFGHTENRPGIDLK